MAIADLEGDALPDLEVATGGDVAVLRNRGGKSFDPRVVVPAGSAPGLVATAGMDADGDLDVVVLDGAGDLLLLANAGDGTLVV